MEQLTRYCQFISLAAFKEFIRAIDFSEFLDCNDAYSVRAPVSTASVAFCLARMFDCVSCHFIIV